MRVGEPGVVAFAFTGQVGEDLMSGLGEGLVLARRIFAGVGQSVQTLREPVAAVPAPASHRPQHASLCRDRTILADSREPHPARATSFAPHREGRQAMLKITDRLLPLREIIVRLARGILSMHTKRKTS